MTIETMAAEILSAACEQRLHAVGVEPSEYVLSAEDRETIASDADGVQAAIRALGYAADEALDSHLAAIGIDLDDCTARAADDATLDAIMGEEAWGAPDGCSPRQFRTIVRDLLALRIERARAELATLTSAEQLARRAEHLGIDGATGAEKVAALCLAEGATREDSLERSTTRHTFHDGSGIVVQGEAWDVSLTSDARCHCWESEDEHHARCALSREDADDDAREAAHEAAARDTTD